MAALQRGVFVYSPKGYSRLLEMRPPRTEGHHINQRMWFKKLFKNKMYPIPFSLQTRPETDRWRPGYPGREEGFL